MSDFDDRGRNLSISAPRRRPRVPRRWLPRRPIFLDASRSALPRGLLRSVQAATLSYTYRGVPCFKSPFDLALYSMLINQQRPGTLVEIGSAAGGSALWFADQCRAQGVSTSIISVDINVPKGIRDPDVRFVEGDVHSLDESELSELLAVCERPLLVVEDGPHTYEGCLAAMHFLHEHLRSGEYLVIEDGILDELGYRSLRSGPKRAVRAFLRDHPGAYEIDRDDCDYFGRNVTWNPSGYLRRQ